MLTKTIKNFEIIIEGTWYEIQNELTNQIIDYGSCEVETEEEAVKIIQDFINLHSIQEKEKYDTVVKRVIWNPVTQDFQQLQAIKYPNTDIFTIQYYNSDMLFIEEIETNFQYEWEVLNHWKNKNIVKGLSCEILTNKELGDCTNNGISSKRDSLILVGDDDDIPKIFEAKDIRECVMLYNHKNYITCKPIIYKDKWYMAGGNFIFSCDSRFDKLNQYPIPIHDRLE